MKTKYDVRRERIQADTNASINSLSNLESVIQQGSKLIGQFASTIQSQQASDWLDKRDAAMNEAMRNGEFTFKTDDYGNKSPMSYDEMIQARENWIKDYSESNPAPWGPWADSIIKKADKSSKQKWDSQITEQAVQVMQNTVRQNAKNAIQSYQDGQYHDPDDIMTSLGVTYETLSPTARSLYDSAMDKDNPDRILASQNFGTQLQFERAGLPENVAYSTVKSSYQPVFAMNNNIQAAVQTFSEQVVSGQMTQADFQMYLDEYADKLGVDGYGGFTQPLSITGKEDFKTNVNNDLASIISGEEERNGTIFREQLKPIIQDFRNRNKTFNSRVAAQYEKELGLNRDFLPEEYREPYEVHIDNQDILETVIQGSMLAERINASDLTDEEKRARINVIAANMKNSGAQRLFLEAADSTPTIGHFLMYSNEQLVDSYSDKFVLPSISVSSGSKSSSGTSGDFAEMNDRDIQEYFSDMKNVQSTISIALTNDPDAMASGIYPISNAMDIWEASLTDEQRAELFEGTPIAREENNDESDSIYRPMLYRSQKANDAFYEWLDEQQDVADYLLMTCGEMNIGDTTLGKLYESEKKDMIELSADFMNGFHEYNENNVESERIRTAQVKQWTINALDMSPMEAQLYLQDKFYRFTKKEQEFYNAMLIPENGQKTILEAVNIDINNLKSILGLDNKDPNTAKILYAAINENMNGILDAYNNPSAASGLYEKIKTSAQREKQALMQNSVGEYKRGELRQPTDLDEYTDPSYFRKRRYSDNRVDSALGETAAVEFNGYLNGDPALKNAFMSDMTTDKSGMKDEDRIVFVMGYLLDYKTDPNNITDEDRANIWKLYTESGLRDYVDTGVTYIMGAYYDVIDAKKNWNLTLENYSDGAYLNPSGTREFFIEHDKDGNIIAIRERKAGSERLATHNILTDMAGHGLDNTRHRFEKEVNDLASEMYGTYTPEAYYSSQLSLDAQKTIDTVWNSEEWQQYAADFKDIFGYDIKPVSDQGGIPLIDTAPSFGRVALVSEEAADNSLRNMEQITLKEASDRFTDQFNDIIPSKVKDIEGYATTGEAAQPYIDQLMATDEWKSFVSDYENKHPGKTIKPSLRVGVLGKDRIKLVEVDR